MYKICKTCSQSNFGIILKKTEERAAKMVNGKITEYFEGSLETKEEIAINYCFTCGMEVSKQDLIEVNICKVCKSEVEQVNENGVCTKCAEEVNKLSEVSREDLILMILEQNKKISSKLSKSCEVNKESKLQNENKEKTVKNIKKSDTIKREHKLNKSSNKMEVEIDNKKKVSSTRKRKSNNKINVIKKENLISQENIDKAIDDNKKKVKSVPKIKSADRESLDYVADEANKNIENVKDIEVDLNIKEDININNINTEKYDSDVIDNTLIEIENIINNMNN